jgi:predicted dehydrogenase
MIRVGIVGFGFMGRMHYRCWRDIEGVGVTAICETNPNIIADAQKGVGNIEGYAEQIDFSKLKVYRDLGQMLQDESLDAVSLTAPTFLHPDLTIQALNAGVHVLCEKPMALTVAECDRMIAAAEKSGKILQIGHCVRFWPEYAEAKRIVDSGKYGKVIAATLQRLGAPPTWGQDNWFMNEKRSGGMVLDLHIHDTDYVQYLLGMPKAVQSFGAPKSGSTAHVVTHYLYDDETVITAEGGWAMMGSFGFEMSFNLVLEKATLVYDCTRDPAFRVCLADGEAFTPEVETKDGYVLQSEHFVKRIQGQEVEPVTTLTGSRDSICIVAAERESVRTGKPVSLA